MAKFGIGVGEEFPVDEPPNPPPPDNDEERGRRRHWRLHHWLHLLTRVAVLALIVSAIVWLFRAPHFYPYSAHRAPDRVRAAASWPSPHEASLASSRTSRRPPRGGLRCMVITAAPALTL